MHRRVSLHVREPVTVMDVIETLEEDVDDATLTCNSEQVLVVEQSVAFSATYRVPWFLFSAYDTGGYAPVFNHLIPQFKLEFMQQDHLFPLTSWQHRHFSDTDHVYLPQRYLKPNRSESLQMITMMRLSHC